LETGQLMAVLRFTILGCGSSGGVPRLGGNWGTCDPINQKNNRRRCSMLVERQDENGITRVLIDTSPDMRAQLLDAQVGTLDGVVFTHSHADHMHGIDDLRMVVFNRKERLGIWADSPTQNALMTRFGYAFVQPQGSPYPPILDLHTIDGDVRIDGAGGMIVLTPFKVAHGSMDALGFRIADLVYLPDVSNITDDVAETLSGLDCWVLDALRRTPHPTHFHLGRSLEWIARVAPKRAVLTNMHSDLDYATLEAETPDHITPAYDGMSIEFEV
jgi:phosphoribosyl 1,2-cyclic phosphate phosphodiesterase